MLTNDLTYEEAIIQLEKILFNLENSDLSISESLEQFKMGIELYKYCNGILSKAEGEVKILLGDGIKDFQELDFLREAEDEY